MADRCPSRFTRLQRPGGPFALHPDEGNWYWYRPAELLVHDEALASVERDLRSGAVALREELRCDGSAMRRFRVAGGRRRVPELAGRYQDLFGSEALVTPVYAFGAAPRSGFGPGTPAEPVRGPRPPLVPLDECDPGSVVGVLDTGVCLRAPLGEQHRRLALDPAHADADEDVLDQEPHDGRLDEADVHGSFIADLIRREAPGATVKVRRALLDGLADELEIADGIRALSAVPGMQVLNLSLYGYTHADREPVVLREAIEALPATTAVVAAAGNDGLTRRTWPAAFARVIGVGAVDARCRPAEWDEDAGTNTGAWVDACALGVDVVSSFIDFTEPGADGRTFAGQARWSGTSFAAPLVAARVIGRVMAERCTATAAAGRLLAEHEADRVPGLGVHIP